MLAGIFFYRTRWVVTIVVDVLQCGIWRCIGSIGALVKVKGDVQEINYLFASLYGDSKSIAVEYATFVLFDVFNSPRCGINNSQSFVPVKPYVYVQLL